MPELRNVMPHAHACPRHELTQECHVCGNRTANGHVGVMVVVNFKLTSRCRSVRCSMECCPVRAQSKVKMSHFRGCHAARHVKHAPHDRCHDTLRNNVMQGTQEHPQNSRQPLACTAGGIQLIRSLAPMRTN